GDTVWRDAGPYGGFLIHLPSFLLSPLVSLLLPSSPTPFIPRPLESVQVILELGCRFVNADRFVMAVCFCLGSEEGSVSNEWLEARNDELSDQRFCEPWERPPG